MLCDFLVAPLLVATHNAGKLEEIAALLAPYGISSVDLLELGLPVPDETADSFAGNATLKACAAASRSGLVALADDSGLCVEVLGGAPGIYTADWAEGPHGRDFDSAMSQLWGAIVRTAQPTPYRASFHCALALAWPNGTVRVFEGEILGEIIWPGRGSRGHGFDPVFLPEGEALTFGELDRWTKNLLGHRGRAFARLAQECFT